MASVESAIPRLTGYLLEGLLSADMSMVSARKPTAAERTFDLKSEENADAFEPKFAKLDITATTSRESLAHQPHLPEFLRFEFRSCESSLPTADMAQLKATRKFEKKHLKDVLERRKKHAKAKQKHQIREKKKVRRAAERADEDNEEEKPNPSKSANGNRFQEMSVDEFFQGGFEIPKELQPKGKKSKDTLAKIGKRKRDDEDDEESGSDEDEEAQEQPVEEDNGPESDPEDDGDHKEQLDALKKKDPEFYKLLQEEDPDLLDFDDDKFVGNDALSDEEDLPKKKGSKDQDIDSEPDTNANAVTIAKLARWEKHMTDTHALRHTKEVILAFKSAAYLNEDDEKPKYTIPNSEVYNRLLTTALKHIPTVLEHHLPVKESKHGKLSIPTESKKFKIISPMLKTHITSIQHLLSTLSDDATQRLTLNAVLPLLPYILSFRKAVRDLTEQVVAVWSGASSTEATRISAFLILRRLVVIGDPGIKESVLRSTYQGLLQGSRNTTVHTISAINLMKNSAAELWGLDQQVGYTTAFTFIRQLAIHLRSCIKDNTKDSYKQVYNWQYDHSLDFWSRVLSQHCSLILSAETGKDSSLKPLIYPVVQVTLGTMRLIPTPQYFPLRFHLVRSLLRLSRATGTYIPLAPALCEVLTSAEMRKPPKSSTLKPLDFETTLRAPKAYLKTRTYQDGLGEQVAELLSEFFVLWCKNIAFPELALPPVVMLKRWLRDANGREKGNRNAKVNGAIALVVQKVESNMKWIEERRRVVEFAPNNRSGVEAFLKEEEWERTPLGAFVVGQRKHREERKRVLEEGRKADERKADERKRKSEREEEDMIDEDGDDE